MVFPCVNLVEMDAFKCVVRCACDAIYYGKAPMDDPGAR